MYGPPIVSVAPTSKKMITIKDLFDIALTTLAFLSFGMFVIQVIMCLTMAKQSYGGDMTMMPMEMIPASAAGLEGEILKFFSDANPTEFLVHFSQLTEVDTTEVEVRSKLSLSISFHHTI